MNTRRIPIVGNSYRDPREQEFFSRLMEDPSVAPLYFEAEPNNPYDPKAIKVCCRTVGTPRIEAHLGYIPRHMTHIIHQAWADNSIIEKKLLPNTNMMEVTIRYEAVGTQEPKQEA